MTRIQEYHKGCLHRNSQEDLQKLAKDIFAHGEIEKVEHHSYSTNNPTQAPDGEFVHVMSGSVCYVVKAEGFPCCFYVHMSGTTVTSITERIDY